MGPAHVVGRLAAGSHVSPHGQSKNLKANGARIIALNGHLPRTGRLKGSARVQVAQPAGELCVSASSSSSSSTVTVPREEDSLSGDLSGAEMSGSTGNPRPNFPEEEPSFSGRVGEVSFQGRTGRAGSYGHQIDSNRSRLRNRHLAELLQQLDEGESMQPMLLGRRRQIIEEQRKQAEEAQRQKMADAKRKAAQERSRAMGNFSQKPLANSSSGSAASMGQGIPLDTPESPWSGTMGPKPKGDIPQDAVGNVVTHNLALKTSKASTVIPEGFAIKIQSGIALPILPHVMVVSGGLGREEIEDLASQRVLSSLLTLDVPKELCTMSLADRDTSGFKDSVQYKAAALARILKRAALKHKPGETIVLLQCSSATLTPAAKLMAAWLHWYGRIDIQEACDRAGAACACHVPRDFIDQASNDLYKSAMIRSQSNYLVWPHGAFHAQVAGDVVGSWFPATSMRKVTHSDSELWDLNPGDWVLPLPELEPGVYRYKYVIDDSWRMDWHQPFDHDGSSNRNNLWSVSSNLPLSQHIPEDRLQVIRKEFISMALRVKMRLGPKMLSK